MIYKKTIQNKDNCCHRHAHAALAAFSLLYKSAGVHQDYFTSRVILLQQASSFDFCS